MPAPKKKEVVAKAKKPVGRPSLYKPEYPERARKLCLLGAADKELADFFEVSVDTINEWKNVHPEFSASIKEGKDQADASVADRLYQRAMGFEHPDIDIRVVNGEIVETPIRKVYPPDTAAAIFWLKNRQRRNWRDKIEQEVSGPNGGPIETKSDVKLTPDEAYMRMLHGGS
jgi:hypothetical protein